MASFSNPASQAKENAAAYVKLLMDLLGDRDPFEVQSQQLATLQAELAGIDEATLRRPEKPGKWSIMQVVQHLADTELVYRYRTRMILAHPTPEIQGYDQDLWATELKYNEMELNEALEQVRVLRSANLKMLRGLNEAQMERIGMHSERGPESVRKILQMLAGHDILHLNQIRRIKQAHGLA
ncbi:DinB family protein [candidate division KSB1 bacterium]|nr:DinB family protein [candidate division KSB1 bacterium]